MRLRLRSILRNAIASPDPCRSLVAVANKIPQTHPKASFLQPTWDRARGRPFTNTWSQPNSLPNYLLFFFSHSPRVQIHVEHTSRIGTERKEAFEPKRPVWSVRHLSLQPHRAPARSPRIGDRDGQTNDTIYPIRLSVLIPTIAPREGAKDIQIQKIRKLSGPKVEAQPSPLSKKPPSHNSSSVIGVLGNCLLIMIR